MTGRIVINPKIAKTLKRLATAAQVGGAGMAVHGIGSQIAAQIRAGQMLANADKDPYWLLRLKGAIPIHSKVLTDENEIAEHIISGIPDYDKMSQTQRSVIRRAALAQAKILSAGGNAAYAGKKNGRPVFLGGKKGMNVGVAAHETGHYRADLLRNNGDGTYMKEYMRSSLRRRRLSDIFERNMWKNEDGSLSRPGYEREAWELAPKKWDKSTMETALDTYKRDRTGGAEMQYGLMTAGGIGVAKSLLRAARRARA